MAKNKRNWSEIIMNKPMAVTDAENKADGMMVNKKGQPNSEFFSSQEADAYRKEQDKNYENLSPKEKQMQKEERAEEYTGKWDRILSKDSKTKLRNRFNR